MVVADTLAQAEDAAELLEIDYEPLPAVTSTADAVGGPAVWEECPDNVSNVHEIGDRAATEAAFGRATRVVRRRYVITRVHAQYMEARGALGAWDPGKHRYTLHADVQCPHRGRTALATNILRVPEHQIRVIAGDVGGGFGTKGWQYPEHRLVLWAARQLGRPVKWRCERREAIPADEHARDNVTEAELALDAEGRFLALRVRTLANVGAYVSSDRNLLATFSNIATLVGVYAFAAAHVQVTSVLTNTSSTAPYRGAGRPEATYVIERLIDDADHVRRLRAPGGDVRDRAPHRRRRARAEHGRGRSPPQEPGARLGDAVQDGHRRHLRLRRFPGADGGRAQARRRLRLPGPPRGGAPARPAARARRRQRDRAGGGPAARVRRDPLLAERQRDGAHGDEEPGPGPRDDVQADSPRAARPRSGRRPLRRRRHRSCRVRHGLDGLALDGHRRHRPVDGCRQGRREGPPDRREAARGRRGRHQVREWRVLGRGHRPRGGAQGSRARRVPARLAAQGRRARPLRDRNVLAAVRHVAERLPRL